MEEQNKAGEMKGCKRWTCSVLPLLQSSQNCNSDDMHKLCQTRYYPIFTSAGLDEIILGIIMRKTQSQRALNTGQSLVIAIDVPQGFGGEGRAKQSPLQTFKGRTRKDPENERSRNMMLVPRKSSRALCSQQGGGWDLKNRLTQKQIGKSVQLLSLMC